ncbi:Loader and inhibitor of phage G40P [Alteromonadaceae bacterium Bs31]|nr:Loader and inhibitor of phage G40P [Alteromonadaceae bacterium Bs31]
MKKNLTIEAGPSETLIDAINQVFALLELNYHNQFYKAFSKPEDLPQIKRLWLSALKRFEPKIILQAIKSIIENNEFLPTLASMIKACEASSKLGLPEAHAAYLEACRAPSPKASQNWSHLAVYYAGRAADWYFLQNNSEHIAFPVFKQHYQELCQRVRLGEKLTAPTLEALPQKIKQAASKEALKAEFSKLRNSLDI